MRAASWLVICAAVAMAAAEGDMILRRRRRQSIIFPGALPPVSAPQPPSVLSTSTGLELPEDLNLDGMDLDSLSLINAIDNITDFADLFGIPLPEDEFSELDLATRFGGSAELAKMAGCMPELQTVTLDLPVETNTLFYPTCVRVQQCGGCCYGPLLTCRPKTTTAVTFQVLKTVVNDSGAGRRRRRRRERTRRSTVPSYHSVEVLKHDACECGCRVQQQDCNTNIHNYLETDCACVCKNSAEKLRCEQQNTAKYWDNDSCTCFCRRPVDCSSGEFFSQASCKCERV